MPEITVTLVDHTDSPDLRQDIMRNLEDIFGDLVFSNSEPGVVNMRWTTSLRQPTTRTWYSILSRT
jgi:hypothetical protein